VELILISLSWWIALYACLGTPRDVRMVIVGDVRYAGGSCR